MSDEKPTPTPSPEERAQALEVLHEQSIRLASAIEEAKVKVLDGQDGQPALLQQLTDAHTNAKSLSGEVGRFHANLHDPANDGSKAIVEAIPETVKLIEQAKERIDGLEADIKTYQEQLLGKKEGDKDVGGIKQDVEEKVKELTDLHSKVYDRKGDQVSVAQAINDFIEELGKKKGEFETIKKEVEGYEEALFGPKGEDGQRKDGIKGQVAGYVKELGELVTTSTATQDRLREQSERILQDAATASLAEDSIKQKNSFVLVNHLWMGAMVVAILLLMGSPFIDFSRVLSHHAEVPVEAIAQPAVGVHADTLQVPATTVASVQPQATTPAPSIPWYVHWLMRLPFVGGAIWLGWYAGKQRSQNKRLQQEYAHKENVAKLYYSLKREVEELEKGGDNARLARILKVRLMRVLVNSMGHNPSLTLDSKAHNDNGPMQKTYDKAFDSVKGVAEAIAKVKGK